MTEDPRCEEVAMVLIIDGNAERTRPVAVRSRGGKVNPLLRLLLALPSFADSTSRPRNKDNSIYPTFTL